MKWIDVSPQRRGISLIHAVQTRVRLVLESYIMHLCVLIVMFFVVERVGPGGKFAT